MKLKKESFKEGYYGFRSDFEKEYFENGLLKSEWEGCISCKYEYNSSGEILYKIESIDNGQGNDFFKKEYKYEGLTTRIFHYKSGYTDLESNYVPDEEYPYLSRIPDDNISINPLNELLSIEEITYNNNKNVISIKKTDLKKSSFSEVKNNFNVLGNLINSESIENGRATSNSIYNYKEGKLDSYKVNSVISYLKYDTDGNICEIDCYEILEGEETFNSNILLKYFDKKLINVFFNSSESEGYKPSQGHVFFDWECVFEERNDTILKLFHILYPDYGYGQQKYEVKFLYGPDNKIIQSTFISNQGKSKTELDSTGNEHTIFYKEKTEENIFFIYKYNENYKSHPVEYIDGFTIKENKIELLFTHKFEYY